MFEEGGEAVAGGRRPFGSFFCQGAYVLVLWDFLVSRGPDYKELRAPLGFSPSLCLTPPPPASPTKHHNTTARGLLPVRLFFFLFST